MAWTITAAVVMGLIALDRAVAHGVIRGPRPRSERKPSSGAGGGPFDALLDVFHPARTHTVEEQQRQRDDIALPGTAAPPVDLDEGVAWLPAPPTDPDEDGQL